MPQKNVVENVIDPNGKMCSSKIGKKKKEQKYKEKGAMVKCKKTRIGIGICKSMRDMPSILEPKG